ncbi:MAG: formylglycine-generating enzyme family protein [Bacteroidetes bacterium]|nr:MAG: formylglycine-generating enzyme family protein [Bacteroidota bacterium]
MNTTAKSIFFSCLLCLSISPAWAQTAPQGMVWVQGGTTKIGNDKGTDSEKPAFETRLAGFWLDQQPVTVGEFKKFIRFTQYRTTAEKHGFGVCYDSTAQTWKKVQGATWQNPTGKAKAEPHEPVRQVSWHDAQAYANWIGKRLPSEFEWEKALQNAETLKLAYATENLWQWCENFYFEYSESNYYQGKLNRPKALRAGKLGQDSRPSLRLSLPSDEFSYDVGFRCAKDK